MSEAGSVFENSLVAVRTFIMHDVPTDMYAPDTVLPPIFVVTCTEGASTPTCHPTCCLQEGLVWHSWRLVDQDVQGFLKDPCLWELHLCTWGQQSKSILSNTSSLHSVVQVFGFKMESWVQILAW